MITIAALNPSVDKLLHVPKLAPGSIHRPAELVAVPGGKGLNVARVAHALGADVRVAGIAGGTAGLWIATTLDALGVPAQWMWVAGESRTCTSVYDATTHELTEFYEPGQPIDADAWDEYLRLIGPGAPDPGWLVVSGSVPPGVRSHQLLTLLEAHRGDTAVDTSGAALRTATGWGKAALVKVNKHEALELLGHDSSKGAACTLPALAGALQRHSGEGTTVVVTGGREGAVMMDRNGGSLWARLPVVGRYSVGSGDSFLAGLLTGLEIGEPLPHALRLATAAAAANAEVPGAGVLDPERVEALMPLVELQEVTDRHE